MRMRAGTRWCEVSVEAADSDMLNALVSKLARSLPQGNIIMESKPLRFLVRFSSSLLFGGLK